jgi:ATP-dependent DNA helicase RecG
MVKMPIQKESHTTELKKSLAQLDVALKSVCAFLNHKGGTVYFGVANDGKITGLNVTDKTLRKISQQIHSRIKPEITPEIREVKEKGESIIELKIPKGNNKPYFLNGVAYKRIGTENRIIPPDELKRIILEQKQTKWDEEICEGATLNDINEEKVERFLRKAKFERRLEIDPTISVKEALKRMDLIKRNKLTNATILLFGKNPQQFFMQSEVRCARFRGTEPLEFIDMKVFVGNIIDQREDAVEFVKEHIKLHAKIVETERVETWEYPIEAVREAITNAVCHRDYEISSNVQVRIFDDRIEVWGCGLLPKPLTVEDLRKKHDSILRNPQIGKCFFLIKFIEQWGTGTNRIISECLKYGLPEPLFEEVAGNLVVTFRKTKFTEDYLKQLGLNERQIKAIHYLKENKQITRRKYSSLFNCSTRTAFNDLQAMIDKKILKRKGKGKYTYYEMV